MSSSVSQLSSRPELDVERAWLLLRSGNPAAAREALPTADQSIALPAETAMNAVACAILSGAPEMGMKLAYAVAARHGADLDVLNRFVAFAMRVRALVPELFQAAAVGPETVVTLDRAGRVETRELVNDAGAYAWWPALELRSPLGTTLMGHCAEEVITDPALGEQVKIVRVESKYAKLLIEVMEAVSRRAGPDAVVRAVPLNERGEPMLASEIKRLGDVQALATHRVHIEGATIPEIARLIGESDVGTWYLLIGGQLGSRVEYARGNDNRVGAEVPLVLDATAVVALGETNELAALASSGRRIVLAQSAVDVIMNELEERRHHAREPKRMLVKRGDTAEVVEAPLEDVRVAQHLFETLLQWCRDAADIVGVPARVADGRQALVKQYSESSVDAALVARGVEGVLVSEDVKMRRLVQERFGVRGASVADVSKWLLVNGHLEKNQEREARVAMMTWRYAGLDCDAEDVLWAFRMDHFEPGRHVRPVLRYLINAQLRADSVVDLVWECAKRLWLEERLVGQRERALGAMFSVVAERGESSVLERDFESRVSEVFRLLPQAESDVRRLFTAWKASRSA